jgi:ribosomal protein S18 acetylase RimI-like enzyme
MDFSIRKADESDIQTLVDLMDLFYAESSYPLDRRWAAESFRFLLTHPSLGCIWIASAGGEDAGYGVLTFRYGMEFGGFIGAIDDLFIKRPYRRQLGATTLLEALFKECRGTGCKSVCVEVGANNGPALGLYGRFGLRQENPKRLLLQVGL